MSGPGEVEKADTTVLFGDQSIDFDLVMVLNIRSSQTKLHVCGSTL